VPAGNLVGVDAEPVFGDAALEPGGKEAVVGAGQHLDGHAGPAPERTRLPEDSTGGLAGRSGGRQDGQGTRRQVVQEMGAGVELAATSGRRVSGAAGLSCPGVLEPLARRLAGFGDHGVQQHDHRDRLADHRRGEAGHRLGDQHHLLPGADRLVDDLGIVRQAQRRVVLSEVHRGRLVAPPLQFGYQQSPVRRLTAGAWHQHEQSHLCHRPLTRSVGSSP
jgi:hypothetical protein